MLVVPRVAGRIRVDGDLDKAPWRDLAPVWLLPSHGRAGSLAEAGVDEAVARAQLGPGAGPLDPRVAWQPTALRTCHDGARLYVAFHCVDRDVFGSYTGRNEPIYEEEVVEAFLAPGPDPRRYVELEANPLGAWFEARVASPDGRRDTMRVDRDWVCAGWQRAVRVAGDLARRDGRHVGWRVEWAIPFASLDAAPPGPGARWRANFTRIDRAGGGQYAAWSPTLAEPADFHVPDRFGVLEFG